MASIRTIQLALPSGTDELDQLRFMIAQFAEAYPRTLKPRDPREFALKIKDQKKQSNKENAVPPSARRLRCYMIPGPPGEALMGYMALSEPKIRGTPPTLKQIFVRKPERGKGLATAALRSIPFHYEDHNLFVEQPVRATHLALESAGWRLLRHDADKWLYCRGVVAESLPKVDLKNVWQWIESEAYGSSWASYLPVSLPFYPAIVSRDSLNRATGDEGVFALLGMCTGQSSDPLYEFYDAAALLPAEPTSNAAPEGTATSTAAIDRTASTQAEERFRFIDSIEAPLLPGDAVPSTPSPVRQVLGALDPLEHLTPLADVGPRSRKRKRREESSEVGVDGNAEVGKLSVEPRSPQQASVKPQFIDLELRVVQSDFVHISLAMERRGMRVSGAASESISGIQANDLITKVDGRPVHSKTRSGARPSLCDGMALLVRRQVC